MAIFGNLFGGSPAESGGSIRVTETAPPPQTSSGGRFPTTLQQKDASMLRQEQEARRYGEFIQEAAQSTGLPMSVICGIGSRESHWGILLKPSGPGGTGDFSQRKPRGPRTGRTPPDGGGFGRGLMQIDYDWHEFARTGNWQDPHANLQYAAKVLNDAKRFFMERGVEPEMLMRAILAAYNAGPTATYKCYTARRDIDCNTTGRDYSADVLNRAGWFQLHRWS